jgi:hypothetical protein
VQQLCNSDIYYTLLREVAVASRSWYTSRRACIDVIRLLVPHIMHLTFRIALVLSTTHVVSAQLQVLQLLLQEHTGEGLAGGSSNFNQLNMINK